MALESANWMSELVVANPDPADPVGQGDDHLRMLKTVLTNTFPAALWSTGAGALTVGPAILNQLDGTTAADLTLNGSLSFAGTVASTGDLRLANGSDIAWRNSGGTGDIVLDTGLLFTGADALRVDSAFEATGVLIGSTEPDLTLVESDAAANEGVWSMRGNASVLQFLTRTDLGAAVDPVLELTRSGSAGTGVNVNAGNLTLYNDSGLARLTVAASTAAQIFMKDEDAALDEKSWDITTNDGQLLIRTVSDNEASAETVLSVTRAGTALSQMSYGSGTGMNHEFNGTINGLGSIFSGTGVFLNPGGEVRIGAASPFYAWYDAGGVVAGNRVAFMQAQTAVGALIIENDMAGGATTINTDGNINLNMGAGAFLTLGGSYPGGGTRTLQVNNAGQVIAV